MRVRPDVFLDQPLLLQHLGGVLETLVLEQAIHQLLPGILFRGHLQQFRVHGQQHLGLDVDQRRGHVDELGAQVDIQLAGLFHVREVLLRDGCDGDVLDFDLLAADQIEKQIERTVVVLQVEV